MEQIMKLGYLLLMIWGLMVFWPLVVFLVIALVVFLAYSSWKTKRMMRSMESELNETDLSRRPRAADIIEAEYIEKEMKDDEA